MWLMKLSGLMQIESRGHDWVVHQKLKVGTHCQPSPINRSNKGISAIHNK